METIPKKVEEIAIGNHVDQASCPFLSQTLADDLFTVVAIVESVERETHDCVKVVYEDIGYVNYHVGTVLQVRVAKEVPDPVVNRSLD